AVDLFASGDIILVTNNIFRNNLIKGVDIKSDTANYPEVSSSYNGKNITISNNVIDNCRRGIQVAQNIENGDYNYMVDVSGNQLINNEIYGANVSGRYIGFRNNYLFKNGENNQDSTSAAALLIGRESTTHSSRY